MIDIYKNAGLRIQNIRNMRGYSRECLAELADISPKFLYEIESGRKGFSADVLFRISNALDVNCDFILTGKTEFIYDQKLLEVLELFKGNQMDRLERLLRVVYEFI